MGPVYQVIGLSVGLFQPAGRGVQLVGFYRSHKHYGYCRYEMYPSKTEWAMLCSHCRERYYSQIVPYIVAVIRRDDPILPAQYTRHRNDAHTALAGFVEVGETLEQAVTREVTEESGIKVKNLRHATSQPWPFPQPLVTTLMAEHNSDEIMIDPKELFEVNWYRYDNLSLPPPPGAVVHYLIEDTAVICRVEYE